MYAFIEGIVEHKSSGELVINAGGVGYLLLGAGACIVVTRLPRRGRTVATPDHTPEQRTA